MAINKYPALDICKFILAIILVCAHYASEYGNFPKLIDMAFSLYIIAVPFYFTSSAFLFFSNNKKSIIPYLSRIMKMYFAWSLIYFIFVLLDWYINGTNQAAVLEYFHKSLVYSFYSTIWFLPALAVGMALTYYLSKKMDYRSLILLAILFYVIGSLGKSYSFLIEGTSVEKAYLLYNSVFFTTRNGVFNAFPFTVIGFVLANKSNNRNLTHDAILSFVLLFFIMGESLLLKLVFHNSDENTIISLLPFTYCFFRFIVGLKWNASILCERLRKLSTYIFCSQRIWLSAIPAISVNYKMLISNNTYLGLLVVLLLTMFLSILIAYGSQKNKYLSILG